MGEEHRHGDPWVLKDLKANNYFIFSSSLALMTVKIICV